MSYMAKKVLGPTNALEQFREMTLRASLSLYYNVAGVLVSRSSVKDNVVVAVPDQALLKLLFADEDIKIEDFDFNDDDLRSLTPLFDYGTKVNEDGWLPLAETEDFYHGKLIEIKIEGHDFPVLITKDLLPLKLKKAEFNDVSYRVFIPPKIGNTKAVTPVLGIKKRFQLVEEHGFTLMRLFQIV
jgi:hypothetical protein